MKRLCFPLFLIATYALGLNAQMSLSCIDVTYRKGTACSLTGVNGSCTIIVDRMRAATPPTIYVRRNSTVTLEVINPSPIEKLELDETSINTQIPIDSVQALAPLLTQLGQFVLPLAQPTGKGIVPLVSGPFASAHPPDAKSFAEIQKEQNDLSMTIVADTTVDSATLAQLVDALGVLRALLVPPVDACNSKSQWGLAWSKFSKVGSELTNVNDAIQKQAGKPGTGAGDRVAADTKNLAFIQADIDLFASGMAAAQKKSDDEVAELKASNTDLQKKLGEEEKKRRPDVKLIQELKDKIASQQQQIETKKKDARVAAADWQVQLDQLKSSQNVVSDILSRGQTIVKTVLFPAESKLEALVSAIGTPKGSSGPFEIKDLLSNDRNDQQEVFTLNAVNYLTDPVKIFIASAATDPYSQMLADSIVQTAPTKTAVMQATVEFVTQPEMEVTAGAFVPFFPYRSYTAVPQTPNTATLVVQEVHTFTIVPTANLNFRWGNDKFAGTKRYGWFGTVAIGYNPATTMVEFGVGPSIALKSMVFSFLASVGRDTELASGFTKNLPLPGAATAPATNGVWSVKPALGFSIRLPFNSGSGH